MNTSSRRPYKPYQLVLVDMGDYQYVGETLSFITPQQTFMVRRVPGAPMTLIELPDTKLVTVLDPRIKRYVHYADVTCMDNMPTSFPIDMLRREVAAPVNFDPETGKIEDEYVPSNQAMVAKLTTSQDPQWNLDRWASFGWKLVHRLTERLVQV